MPQEYDIDSKYFAVEAPPPPLHPKAPLLTLGTYTRLEKERYVTFSCTSGNDLIVIL